MSAPIYFSTRRAANARARKMESMFQFVSVKEVAGLGFQVWVSTRCGEFVLYTDGKVHPF